MVLRRRYGRRRMMRRTSYKTKFVRQHGKRFNQATPELKCMDFSIDTLNLTSFASNGQRYCLNQTLPGTGFYNRIGSRIKMKSVDITIDFFPNTASTALGNFYRIMLIYDAQTNGAMPNVSDVISSVNAAGSPTSGYWQGLNMNNRDRFLILRDWMWSTLGEGATPGTAATTSSVLTRPVTNPIKWHIKLRGLETMYKGETAPLGSVSDIATGGLYLWCWAGAGSGILQGVFTSRLRFYD